MVLPFGVSGLVQRQTDCIRRQLLVQGLVSGTRCRWPLEPTRPKLLAHMGLGKALSAQLPMQSKARHLWLLLQTLPREFQVPLSQKETRNKQPHPDSKSSRALYYSARSNIPSTLFGIIFEIVMFLEHLLCARHSKRFLVEMIKMMSKRNFLIYLAFYTIIFFEV